MGVNMTNFIIISDLHIDVYDNRLPKYIELGNVLVDKCLKTNSKELIIAGDILNTSVTPPKVIYALKDIIDNFNRNGISVSYILGQHDFNLRNINGDLTNTYLPLLNMKYLGGQHRNVEGIDIYFKDFERTNCVVPDKCDILIGHVSLGFQDIDQSNIKYIGLCGDIHKPTKIGKCVSICPPMQIHGHEPQEGYCIELSIDNGKIVKCNKTILPTIFKLPKPQRLKVLEDVKSIEVNKEVESYKVPESIVNDLDLSGAPKPIDLNFRVTRLEITNYKAIRHRVIELDNNKIVFLQGPNGCSKTTTLDALYYSFVKSRQKFDSLKVDFEYHGFSWTIIRSNDCRILKDGVDIPFKSKNEFESTLVSLFPFVTLLDFFYVRTYRRFFECDRVRLFEELFNLKEYSYVAYQCKSLIKSYESKLNELNLQLSNSKGQYEAYKSQIIEMDIDRDGLLTEYTKLKEWSDKINTLEGMKSATESNISRLSKSISYELLDKEELVQDQQLRVKRENLVRQISKIKNQIIVCPNCGTKIHGSNIDDLEAELASLPEPKYESNFITNQLYLIDTRDRDINNLKSNKEELDKITNRIKELSDRLVGKDLNSMISLVNKYDYNETLKSKVIGLESTISDIESQISVLKDKIKDTESLINSVDIKNPESIPVKILERLVSYIETDNIKISILSQLKNGNDKLDIQVVYHGIDYDDLSSGEKCIIDLQLINCISKSLGMVGIIILDESLAGLDTMNYELAGELLSEFTTYNVLITSHQMGFSKYDKRIELSSGEDECCN